MGLTKGLKQLKKRKRPKIKKGRLKKLARKQQQSNVEEMNIVGSVVGMK